MWSALLCQESAQSSTDKYQESGWGQEPLLLEAACFNDVGNSQASKGNEIP